MHEWIRTDVKFFRTRSQGSYSDYLVDPEANREIYNFWRDKTRARIFDPVKRELLSTLR